MNTTFPPCLYLCREPHIWSREHLGPFFLTGFKEAFVAPRRASAQCKGVWWHSHHPGALSWPRFNQFYDIKRTYGTSIRVLDSIYVSSESPLRMSSKNETPCVPATAKNNIGSS